jgi:hypothetical protein
MEEWLKKERSVLGGDPLVVASQLTGFDRTPKSVVTVVTARPL